MPENELIPDYVIRENDRYARNARRLGELADRLKGMRFDARHDNDFEAEMTYIQTEMMRRRPWIKDESGLWVEQPRGMKRQTLAQRKANGERVFASTMDGDFNPETDLQPSYIVPTEVKVGSDGATTIDGLRWAEEAFKNAYPMPNLEPRGFYRIPRREWGDKIDHGEGPNCARFVKFIMNQGSVGSCAAEGEAGSGHCCAFSRGYQSQGSMRNIAPQPYFLYKVSSGGVDGGSNPHDNWALLQRLGCCTQAIRPRSRGWRANHTQAELDDAAKHKALSGVVFPYTDVELLGTFLFSGFPVGCGYSGHWWYAIDILSQTMLKWVNSWGPNWADGGMSTISTSRLAYMCIAKLDMANASQVVY